MDTAAPISTLPCGSCKDLLNRAFLNSKGDGQSVNTEQPRTTKEWISSIELGCPFCWWIFHNHMSQLKASSQSHSVLIVKSSWTPAGWGYVKLPMEVTDGKEASYEFWWMAEEGNPAAKYIGRRPAFAIGSDEEFEFARSQITSCVENHATCKRSKPTVLPFRLIDISSSDTLILCEDLREQCQYAALSYCWGKSTFLQTTKENLQRHCQQGIPLSELPLTLQDAVYVARIIGVRHMWIDCLCIVQDDHEDKIREIENMRHIFSNAWVTISAASASSVDDGFLCHRSPWSGEGLPSIALPWKTPDGKMGTIHLYHRVSINSADSRFVFRDPIHWRAWTFQEHMLAARVLIYSKQQLIFICQKHTPFSAVAASRRGNHSAVNDVIKPLSQRQNDKEGSWYSLIGEYSARQITVESDKLPAIAGIASYFGVGENYRAGLWKGSLISDLLWFIKDPHRSRRVQRWRAPSWSWAALEGQAVHLQMHELGANRQFPVPGWGSHKEIQASVVECTVTPVHASAPFGEIAGARLSLRGHLTTMQLDLESMFIYFESPRTQERIKVAVAMLDTMADFKGPSGKVPPDQKINLVSVLCLAVMAFNKPKDTSSIMSGLLLRRARSDNTQEYSRIGIFRSLEDMDSYFWTLKLVEFRTLPQNEHLIYDTHSHDSAPSTAGTEEREVVHENIICVGTTCQKARDKKSWIRGVRYWCSDCGQDYCGSCKGNPFDHLGPQGGEPEEEFHRYAVFTRPVTCNFMSNQEWKESLLAVVPDDPTQVVDLV